MYVVMKWLILFFSILPCSASESVTALEECAARTLICCAESREAGKYSLESKEELATRFYHLPESYRLILVRQYLKELGFCPLNSLVSTRFCVWMYADLTKEIKTDCFRELGDEFRGSLCRYHRRPTRTARNCPSRSSMPRFPYVYKIENPENSRIHYRPILSFMVGPSEQSLSAYLIKDQNRLYICEKTGPENSMKLLSKVIYGHFKKGRNGFIGFVGEKEGLWDDYEEDCPTALTMDEETSYCYAGTASGKLHCYSFCYTSIKKGKYEKPRWIGYTFPLSLEVKIDDIELSIDRTSLWILADNKLYHYDIRLNELTLKLTIPALSSDEEDETAESMCVLRRGKGSHWWVLGGTKGTVLLVDTEKGGCFIVPSFTGNEPIADIWWKNDELILLNYAGKLRRGTISLEYAEEFFKTPPVVEKELLSD